MPIVKSAGIPTILSVISVQGFIGCGNSRIIVVRSIVPLVPSMEDQEIGEDSISKHQLPTTLQVVNIDIASCVMLTVCGVRTPPAIVSGVRITQH